MEQQNKPERKLWKYCVSFAVSFYAGLSWTVPGQYYPSVEATAYAVLALVKAKDFDKAGEAVYWLARQQSYYGGSHTTQVH